MFCAIAFNAVAQDFSLELSSPDAPLTLSSVQPAPEVRIGVLNIKALFQALPETAELQARIDMLRATYHAEISKLEDEYQSKVSGYLTDRETLPKNIQDARIQEIDQLQLRVQAMRREAAEDLDRKQAEATEPLRARVGSAIAHVSQNLGLAYVLDLNSEAVLYISPSHTVNIFDDVMNALNQQ